MRQTPGEPTTKNGLEAEESELSFGGNGGIICGNKVELMWNLVVEFNQKMQSKWEKDRLRGWSGSGLRSNVKRTQLLEVSSVTLS